MWVQSAIEKYNRRTHINAVAVKTSESVWTNADGDVFNYTVNVGDVRNLDSVLQPKSYTLAVADIPYGFNAPGSKFDEIPFLSKMCSTWSQVLQELQQLLFGDLQLSTPWHNRLE